MSDTDKKLLQEHAWELYQEYRNRVRQYAWVTIVAVPAAFAYLGTQEKLGVLGIKKEWLAIGCIVALFLGTLQTLVCLNGLIANKADIKSKPNIKSKPDETIPGKFAGLAQPGAFALILTLEAVYFAPYKGIWMWWLLIPAGLLIACYMWLQYTDKQLTEKQGTTPQDDREKYLLGARIPYVIALVVFLILASLSIYIFPIRQYICVAIGTVCFIVAGILQATIKVVRSNDNPPPPPPPKGCRGFINRIAYPRVLAAIAGFLVAVNVCSLPPIHDKLNKIYQEAKEPVTQPVKPDAVHYGDDVHITKAQ